MPWKLREGLYWCDSGGRAIFLDLQADRYFCLPSETNAAFLRAASDAPQRCDPERLKPLIRRGLLIESEAGIAIRPPAAVEAPEADFQTDPSARTPMFAIIRAISSELGMEWSLRRRPLHDVIASVGADGPDDGFVPPDRRRSVQRLVSAASAAAFLLRSHDRCLVRGLAFHASCRKKGFNTKLVLGVIAHPFTAHCWVQAGRIVLLGGYEQARLYTPILVLE